MRRDIRASPLPFKAIDRRHPRERHSAVFVFGLPSRTLSGSDPSGDVVQPKCGVLVVMDVVGNAGRVTRDVGI